MDQIFQQLINSISLGSTYALMALGYTMVYGIIKLINFAHGDIYMLGAFLGYYFIGVLKLNLFVAMILSMIVCAVAGVVVEYLAYRPLRNSSRIAVLITAIGVSFLIENVMIYFFSSNVRNYPPAMQNAKYSIFGVASVTKIQLTIIFVSIILMLLLQYVIKFTKMGKAMRAVSVDQDAAKLMGINVDRTISFTFALGSALAASGGILVGIYYNTINPLMGVVPGLKAFIAAVLGGIGIIPGAALGGYAIGIIETLVSATGYSVFKEAIVYLVLIIILLVKPAGLLGKNVKEKV
ncbi:MAG: branched-chain amino acid ABC transporter permease [Bavariicoccus seileri]|uniref:Branched-chain amino acid ABC transporter permease n=1 Tax=Bavariicoccus seileri TaxID=549685 RepID=A0A3D4S4H0_9ENTE|nr:branched-chain amino acid ABC transporter permease [Bavariicoccus seileri]HCS93630.1 branched-chain amino acid ABC transporter permease [Bavariicoccus seileri]